jgi:chromosome segregation ATPase
MGISQIGVEIETSLSLAELMDLLNSPKRLKEVLAEFNAASRKANKAVRALEVANAEQRESIQQERVALGVESKELDKKRGAIEKREGRIEGIDADMTAREASIQRGLKDLKVKQGAFDEEKTEFDKGIGAAVKKAERDKKAAEKILADAKTKEAEVNKRMKAMQKVLS